MVPGPRLAVFGLVVAATVFAAPLRAAVVLDRAGAVNAVVTQLGPGGFTQMWCPYMDYGFGHRGLLPAGTVVRPEWAGGFPHIGNAVTLSCPMYVFFVDPIPNGLYTHDVQYVFVDATVPSPNLLDGTIHVEPQGWFPVIRRFGNEESFFGLNGRSSALPSGPDNPDGLVFEAVPPPLPPLLYEEPVPRALLADAADYSKACVIVATGVDSLAGEAEKGLTRSAKRMKQELIDRGVPPGRTFAKYKAGKDDLRDVIKRSCAASVNPPCEKIYFYLGSHGGLDSLQLKDGIANADTLCRIFKELGGKKVPVCLMIEACKSGSLVDNLRPKLPGGVIVTSTGPDSLGWSGDIDGVGYFGFFSYLFMQCWNSAAADSNGDGSVGWDEAFKWLCNPANAKANYKGHPWDVKTRKPMFEGMAAKSEEKTKPGTGCEKSFRYDHDHSGAFDKHVWKRDQDCDGTYENEAEEWVVEEDGKTDRAHVFRDQDDDGIPETRYDLLDVDNDGDPDSMYCAFWNGVDYTVASAIARRSVDSFSITPGSGSEYGGQSFTLNAVSTFWSNPNVKVFIGTEATGVVWQGPTQIQGMTTGYFPGPHDVIVADFDSFSPSFGFDVLNDGYTYLPEMAVEGIDPPHGWCGNAGMILTVNGHGFDPGAQVYLGPTPIPATYVNAETLTVSLPSCSGPYGPVEVKVENPDLESASLDSAFTFLTAPDLSPPVLTCPPELYLAPGPDGLARIPTGWEAEGTDESGQVSVNRSTLGALAGGTHEIRFDAVDGAGNRSFCTALVHVSGSSTVPTPRPTAFAMLSPYPNPFSAAASVHFALPEAVPVQLRVFSLAGRLVATIADRPFDPGEYDLSWNGQNDDGSPAPSGVYFLHLEAGAFQATRRATLVR